MLSSYIKPNKKNWWQ